MREVIFRAILSACLLAGPISAQETPSSPQALAIQDFEKRVDDYLNSRKSAVNKVPKFKPTDSSDAITEHEKAVADAIRSVRPQAQQGDIFGPAIQGEFRRLIGHARHRHQDAARIDKSLRRAEPVNVKLQVNQAYPAGVPLQSTPPSLLMHLPRLPEGLEYRIVGHDLALRDVESNLVADFISGIIP